MEETARDVELARVLAAFGVPLIAIHQSPNPRAVPSEMDDLVTGLMRSTDPLFRLSVVPLLLANPRAAASAVSALTRLGVQVRPVLHQQAGDVAGPIVARVPAWLPLGGVDHAGRPSFKHPPTPETNMRMAKFSRPFLKNSSPLRSCLYLNTDLRLLPGRKATNS